MNASLLFAAPEDDRDSRSLAPHHEALISDLNLNNLLDAMARGDAFVRDIALRRMLDGREPDLETIGYRQQILADALQNSGHVLHLYGILTGRLDEYRKYYRENALSFSSFVTTAVRITDAVCMFGILMDCVEQICGIIDGNGPSFTSQGFRRYFAAFREFFCEDFITDARRQASAIRSSLTDSCVHLSAVPGQGMKGSRYILRDIGPRRDTKNGGQRARISLSGVGIQTQAARLRDAAVINIVYLLSEVNRKTLDMLDAFRHEIAFYAGCIRLHDTLRSLGVPLCFPQPKHRPDRGLAFCNLVDAGMALGNSACPVGNSFESGDMRLLIVTGANQGGKSTFLRSIGCAQLMMQCGMFVAADSFSAGLCSHVFTHFCHSESGKADQGKLDEELGRMSRMVDEMDAGSLVLLNESFSSAAEREASHMARQIIGAFYELKVRTLFITHIYDFAKSMEQSRLPGVHFLVARRNEDGSRPFIMDPAAPEPTSFGMDIYEEIFGG